MKVSEVIFVLINQEIMPTLYVTLAFTDVADQHSESRPKIFIPRVYEQPGRVTNRRQFDGPSLASTRLIGC